MIRWQGALLVAASLLLIACGNDAQTAQIDCGEDLASDAELAQTPRNDSNLEQLALVVTDAVVAAERDYERVVGDVTGIREMRPDLSDVDFRPTLGQGLILRADQGTIAAMQAGYYDAWNCLNDRFGLGEMSFGTDITGTPDRVRLAFEGIYRISALAERYGELPNIESASEELLLGDGSTICATRGDADWHYVVDEGSGDCPAGCIHHDYSYFVTSVDGTVTPSGSWAIRSGDPTPAWVTSYVTPQACGGP